MGAAALAAEQVRVVETLAVPKEQLPVARGASHELRLSLYTFRGTRWVPREIVAAVLDSARLLAQCGVALAGVELRVLEAPRRFHFYSTPVSRELLREVAVSKPAIFYVNDTLNQPAYDAEAIGLANAATRPELANTIWFAYGSRDLPLVLAHELVHVLSDSGDHSDEPGNLMRAETSPANTRLSDAQCHRLRSRGEANGLLTRHAVSERERGRSQLSRTLPNAPRRRQAAACGTNCGRAEEAVRARRRESGRGKKQERGLRIEGGRWGCYASSRQTLSGSPINAAIVSASLSRSVSR